MEKIIKKGENISEELMTFFIDGEVINQYITAGMDMSIRRDNDEIYISTEEEADGCLYVGNTATVSKTFIKIDTNAMQNDGKSIVGPLVQVPSCVHFTNSEKTDTCVHVD
jgi:hypothetical protein